MRVGGIAAAVAAMLVVTGCSGGDGDAVDVPEEAATIIANDYVALGDSYAAGLGGGGYTDTSCLQSRDDSYPQLWIDGRGTDSLGETVNKACSGAVISSVRDTQLAALTERTGWVTLTVGGNDVGFVAGLQQCVLGSDRTCAQSVRNAVGTMGSKLPGALGALYTEIRQKAPNAEVYVVGYPHLVAGPGDGVPCEAVSDTRRKILNEASDTLSEVIAKAAGAHPGFTYVDVRDAFAGHEACTKDPWIHALGGDLSESFHPTARGYRAYAETLLGVTGT